MFEPIAIVGQGCVLPGGLNPGQLWATVRDGRDALTSVPAGYWGVSPEEILQRDDESSYLDRSRSDRGGYVLGFEGTFDPSGLLLPPEAFDGLDVLHLWAMEAARQALESAGWRPGEIAGRAGIVLGNLSYPSAKMIELAENVWRGAPQTVDWRNRFTSGLPAHLVAAALGLDAGAAAVDAACASSLYAIKLACDRLHERSADVMLAGGVNGASDLLLHVGFTALQALSRTGRSRPFHRDADGLVPAQGAALLALRRLEDARADGSAVLGVIRGVGLSNDGRGHGLLVPSQQGQERAMRLAYAQAGLDPRDISLVECHATGTSRGDLTELQSMSQIFSGLTDVPIGSLKSNLGHSITASGAAAVIKVIGAMRDGIRPPTLHAEDPLPYLAESPFRLLTAAEPWAGDRPRRAAINNFGFGGNNAHLLVEEWVEPAVGYAAVPSTPVVRSDGDVAIVGLSVLVGNDQDTASFVHTLVTGEPRDADAGGARMGDITLDVTQTRFPPADLQQTQPQQLALLAAALNLGGLIKSLPSERASIVVGMGCDAEVSRFGARWRLAGEIKDPAQLAAARDEVVRAWTAAGVVGAMPNVVANRLNSQFDICGPSFTVSREELSGTTALDLAARALRRGEIDAAVVGAVDLSCEPVHQAAATALLGSEQRTAADAAVILVLKRADDAHRDGDTVLGMLPADQQPRGERLHVGTAVGALDLSPILGHAHAASGLLQVAAGALYGLLGVWPDGVPWRAEEKSVVVALDAIGDQHQQVVLVLPTGSPHEDDELAELLTPPEQSQTRKPMLLSFPSHLPHVVLRERVSVLSGVSADIPAPTTASQPSITNRHLEQPMTTHLPVPPVLPAVAESFARAPMIADDDRQLPPEPLSVRFGAMPVTVHHSQTAPVPTPVSSALTATTPAPHRTPYLPNGGAYRTVQPERPLDKKLPVPTVKRQPVGLTLDKDGLRVHSSGKISQIYGPTFTEQDGYARQVRMPEPPLLLADRLLGIDAEPAKAGTGTLWTETDVTADSWWLHQGRMPAGIMIEAGQADLMLISWMGADLLNKGDRVYRLLGCEVTYLGGLPEIGDTLRFDIHVDGHARQGDIRLFFFHYDCTIDGVERMSMRNGQAGFFSDAELAASGGILWRPEDETVSGPMEQTPAQPTRTSLQRSDLEALAAGKVWQTFGAGFERAASHSRPPVIAGGDMLFVDEVTDIDVHGGPWGRGYLRAVEHINPDKWYFAGHFKNDPCMPGTLMFEAAMQTMAIYMTSLGLTLGGDGWRFEPVPFETYKLVCRGQVTPQSRELVYEVFVREVIAGPEPMLFADLLCTIDGLGAFHCSRMGLKLSPGCPMDMGLKELDGYVEPKPFAEFDGVKFDYAAMLACAVAKPSLAVGPLYEKFDSHRRVARLPGPPYHFMSRVAEINGELGVVKAGNYVIAEYDVPPDAWYFAENKASNGVLTMPNAVLMEIALQPCGWLGAYAGCPLDYDVDLFFRNLDGTGIQHREITPSTGTLRIRATLKSIAKAGGTIIATFDGEISDDAGPVYTFDTVFGYFRLEALQQQVGLPVSDEQRALVELPCTAPVVDLHTRPAQFFGAGARLADSMLLMMDRVTGRWPGEGAAGLGRWRAVKDVNPDEWYFKAHFYRDPVQPGSLGIEMMLQLLQFAMLDLGYGEQLGPRARFEPVALQHAITWRYRGQIVPTNKLITAELEITRLERGADGSVLAVCESSLWLDGKRIYSASELGMRLVPGGDGGGSGASIGQAGAAAGIAAAHNGSVGSPGPVGTAAGPTAVAHAVETILDPSRDTWVNDHCPSYLIPSLPMMSVLDLLARAASEAAGGAKVLEVNDLELTRWVVVDGPTRLRAVVEPSGPGRFAARLEVWRNAARVELSRWETHARAEIVTAQNYTGAPSPASPLDGAIDFVSPYDGTVFHGPAFATLMDGARIGRNGSTGTLDIDRCGVPTGLQQPGLLDGALHIVPHTAMNVWTTAEHEVASYLDAADPTVGFPRRVIWARFYSDAPVSGRVDVDARFVGFDDEQGRMPIIDLWLTVRGTPWAQIRLAETLLDKGPLAAISGPLRRVFVGQRRAVPGVSLSVRECPGVMTLDSVQAATQEWFKGTLKAVYSTDSQGDALIADIAAKEAVADAAHGAIHPSQVRVDGDRVDCPSLPLERIEVEIEPIGPGAVRATASLRTDWTPIRRWYNDRLDIADGSFADLVHWALLSRYVRYVIVTDPLAMQQIRGRSVVLLGNHQVQIESLLGTTIASWLTGTPVATIANAKHEGRWIGELLRLIEAVTGNPLGHIRYFDQSNPAQFLDLVADIKRDAAERGLSTMVHADGTRAVHSGQRVERLTSTLLDMAIESGQPIIPVYFAGGLPEQPMSHKLEVPYRHAAQDYIFGRPIMPEEVAAWPYAQRRSRILKEINSLAPYNDAPHTPNLAAESRIAEAAPGLPPLEEIWACIEDALDGLGPDWRETIPAAQWAATRSAPQGTAATDAA